MKKENQKPQDVAADPNAGPTCMVAWLVAQDGKSVAMQYQCSFPGGGSTHTIVIAIEMAPVVLENLEKAIANANSRRLVVPSGLVGIS